ncbi:unnamed protein product [Durusdinium trenchii]|uniref:Uncharacterized protein n=1 Tax=Durusdinium trenchii TaxID=1381693 RepID=A0ABP0M3L9_9DINO
MVLPSHVAHASAERFREQESAGVERRYGAIGAFDYQMDVNTWRSASKSEFMYVEVGSLVSTQAADEAGESALDGFGLEDQGEIPKVNGTASDKVAFQQQCQNYHREKWLTLSQILDIMESSRDGSIEETRQKLRVLDVGTGDGKTLAYLHSRGYPWCNLLGISAEDMRNQKLLEDELPFDPGCPVSSYWVGNVEQLVRSEEGLQMLQGGKFDLIVSWVTFCWLADPVGTLAALYNSWLELGGCMLISSLPFLLDSKQEIPEKDDAGVEYVPSEQQEQLWFISWVEYLRQEHGMQIQVMRDGFNGVYFWWLQYKPNAVPLVLEPALNYGDLLGNSTCYGINVDLLDPYRHHALRTFLRPVGPFDVDGSGSARAPALLLPSTCRRSFEALVLVSSDRQKAMVLRGAEAEAAQGDIQVRLRRIVIECLAHLDQSDAKVDTILQYLRELLTKLDVCNDQAIMSRKQWLRLRSYVCIERDDASVLASSSKDLKARKRALSSLRRIHSSSKLREFGAERGRSGGVWCAWMALLRTIAPDFEGNMAEEAEIEMSRLPGGGPTGKAPLVRALRARQPDLKKVACLWLDRFHSEKYGALAELIGLVMATRSGLRKAVADISGETTVMKEDLEETSLVVDTLKTTLQKLLVEERAPPEVVSELAAALVQEAVEKGADFSQHWLVSREKGAVRVRENFPAIWRELALAPNTEDLLGDLVQRLRASWAE